jgi:hypothetical protein
MIRLDELPDLTRWKEIGTFGGTHVLPFPGIDYTKPEVKLKGDVIGTTGKRGKYGFEFDTYSESTTNWPVEPKWLQRR